MKTSGLSNTTEYFHLSLPFANLDIIVEYDPFF